MFNGQKDKNMLWLVSGIITGFILGLSYFVVGVYNHSKNRSHLLSSNIYSDYDHAERSR